MCYGISVFKTILSIDLHLLSQIGYVYFAEYDDSLIYALG